MTEKSVLIPELLSPAGSPDALRAAIDGGADAVYFGGELYSNRMRAKNFTEEELAEAIELCKIYGVKSYITMNTRLRSRELEDAINMAKFLWSAGADAFITADMGLALCLRENIDGVELHASTQMTGMNALDAKVLHGIGFSRMVCPRELSFEELCRLANDSPIEIEAFVHGAHCVSLSGQCLMSWAMGGRSGNRGECAQPCRLPYKVGGVGIKAESTTHPLSMRDMCLAQHIPEVISTGVASLKLEGRLKSASYVYGVTSIYRKLLDERRAATNDEMKTLSELFSRGGFTDGYFTKKYTKMTGVRPDGVGSRAEKYAIDARRVPLCAEVTVCRGIPSGLTLSDGRNTVTVTGEVPQEARSAPLDVDMLCRSISRLGATPYSLDRDAIKVHLDDGMFMTAAQLNDLRRKGISSLTESARASDRREIVPHEDAALQKKLFFEKKPAVKTAQFLKSEDVPTEAYEYFDEIFLPPFCSEGGTGVNFPVWTSDGDAVRRIAYEARERGCTAALCHTYSQLAASREAGLAAYASYRFNVTNSEAVRALVALGADYVMLSPELGISVSTAIARDCAALEVGIGCTLYGRIPLMQLRRCILRSGGCNNRERCGRDCSVTGGNLTDRKGVVFPVTSSGDGVNTIWNSCPLWAADRLDGVPSDFSGHFIFTDEGQAEASRVIKAYINGEAPRGTVRRI